MSRNPPANIERRGFLPAARESGSMPALGELVITQACLLLEAGLPADKPVGRLRV